MGKLFNLIRLLSVLEGKLESFTSKLFMFTEELIMLTSKLSKIEMKLVKLKSTIQLYGAFAYKCLFIS
jgi:hypothetical protein